MVSLKDKLLDIIAGSLPGTPEVLEFIDNGDFGVMLDKVMDTIAEHITESLSDVIK